jgi:hypothetical protein
LIVLRIEAIIGDVITACRHGLENVVHAHAHRKWC